jgi:hypothetical protein
MTQPAHDSLIDTLTQDLKPVKPMMHPALRGIAWALIAGLYTAVVIYMLGLRPDMAQQMRNPSFLFENIAVFLAGLGATFAAAWLCVPDMRGQKWLASLPLTLLGAFLLWTVARSVGEGLNLQHMHWSHCLESSVFFGFLPAAAIVFMTRRGATTMPYLTAAMSILAVTAFGYVGLRLICINDTVGHVMVYHVAPFAVFGIILGLLARRLYRW